MIQIFLGAILVLSSALVVGFFILRGLRRALKAEREKSATLAAAVAERDQAIKTIQEAGRVQIERTEQISTGSVGDRVSASIGVLSDITKTGARRRRD